MFDLEESIVDWRKKMQSAGPIPAEALDEMESHLREDMAHLLAAGKADEEAFRIAAARVGKPRAVVAEFNKAKHGSSVPMTLGPLIWGVMAALLLALLLSRWVAGKLSLLLVVHIFTVMVGYCTPLFVGALAICHVLGWPRQLVSANLARAISLSASISAALVAAALLTGMFWSSQNLGRYWTNDPREIGALCALIWLAAVALIQRSGRLDTHRAVQLSLVGNMLIALAWFGAGTLHHGYGIITCLPLDVFLGLHLFFLGVTVNRSSNTLEA